MFEEIKSCYYCDKPYNFFSSNVIYNLTSNENKVLFTTMLKSSIFKPSPLAPGPFIFKQNFDV